MRFQILKYENKLFYIWKQVSEVFYDTNVVSFYSECCFTFENKSQMVYI
jgi:hypothetical protein